MTDGPSMDQMREHIARQRAMIAADPSANGFCILCHEKVTHEDGGLTDPRHSTVRLVPRFIHHRCSPDASQYVAPDDVLAIILNAHGMALAREILLAIRR